MPADASPDDVGERNGRVEVQLRRRVAANHGKIRRSAYPSIRHPAQEPAADQQVSISISFKPTTITTSTTIPVTSTSGQTGWLPSTPPVFSSAPVTVSSAPVTESSAPVTESSPPVTEWSPPVTESSPPVTEWSPPATGESPAQTVVLTVITTFVPVTITIPVQAPINSQDALPAPDQSQSTNTFTVSGPGQSVNTVPGSGQSTDTLPRSGVYEPTDTLPASVQSADTPVTTCYLSSGVPACSVFIQSASTLPGSVKSTGTLSVTARTTDAFTIFGGSTNTLPVPTRSAEPSPASAAPPGSHPSTGVVVGAIVGCVTLLLLISLLYLRRRQLAKRNLELDETNSLAAKEPHMVDIAQLEVSPYVLTPEQLLPSSVTPELGCTSSRKRLVNGPVAASGPDDNAASGSADALLVPNPPDHATPPAPPPKERWTMTKRSRPRTPVPGPDPHPAPAVIDVSTAPIASAATEATGGAVAATALQAEVELLRQRVDIITDREAERERAARGPTADVPPAYDVPAVQVIHSRQ